MTARSCREVDHFACPHCGARVAVSAESCRECGASRDSGWSEEGLSKAMAVAIAATNEQGDELAFYCRDCAFVFNSAPDGTGYEQVACPRCRQMCMTVEFENSEQERHHNEGVFFSILGALTGLLFHAHPHVHVPSRKLQLTLPKPVTIASYEHRADAESDLQVLAQKESKQLSIPFRKKRWGVWHELPSCGRAPGAAF